MFVLCSVCSCSVFVCTPTPYSSSSNPEWVSRNKSVSFEINKREKKSIFRKAKLKKRQFFLGFHCNIINVLKDIISPSIPKKTNKPPLSVQKKKSVVVATRRHVLGWQVSSDFVCSKSNPKRTTIKILFFLVLSSIIFCENRLFFFFGIILNYLLWNTDLWSVDIRKKLFSFCVFVSVVIWILLNCMFVYLFYNFILIIAFLYFYKSGNQIMDLVEQKMYAIINANTKFWFNHSPILTLLYITSFINY